ncbi:MAG: hypothetical protein KAH24_05725, partial [Holophagae bacterium]|nr:hypothetical protein [Holophagae bacterium]
AIEKPFTSDALKEKCQAMETDSAGINELDGLSPEELESITEEEFMLSEEDILDIGEEDLADIEIPDSPPETEEPETADVSNIPAPELASDDEETTKPPVPPFSEGETKMPESAAEVPFEDMEMDEDLDSIDFGDLEDGESLLDKPVPDEGSAIKPDSVSEEDTVSTTEQELAGPSEEEPAIPEISEAAFAGESDKEKEGFDNMDEELLPEMEEVEGEAEEPISASDEEAGDFDLESTDAEDEVLPEVGPQTIREAVQFEGEEQIPSPIPEQVLEEAEASGLDDLLSEELIAPIPETGDEPDMAQEEAVEEDLPDVNFAIEEEPQTVHVDEYDVERPPVEAEELAPLDVSLADENVELIPAPSSLSTEGLSTTPSLSDTDIQKIAERVVAMLSDKAIRDIAWEVIPVVAEEIVRGRIRQLENEEVE